MKIIDYLKNLSKQNEGKSVKHMLSIHKLRKSSIVTFQQKRIRKEFKMTIIQ